MSGPYEPTPDERRVIAWLREQAEWHDKNDDGWSGFDRIAQAHRDAAQSLEQGHHHD